MRRLLDVKIGDIYDDLKCVDIRKAPGKSTEYLMECEKCGREKWMLSSTIRIKSGTTHKACGKGIKLTHPIFYQRWTAMRTRTNNPNYAHYDCYGGRGINSDEFELFIDFYDAMFPSYYELASQIGEENTSLERVNTDGNYSRDNCIWIPKNEQQGNQRRTIDFIAVFPDGHKERCRNVAKFARDHSLNGSTIRDVLNKRISSHKHFKFYYANQEV